MPSHETIQSLLACAQQPIAEDEQEAFRLGTRVLWVNQFIDTFGAAQQRVTDAWDQRLKDLPDDLSDEELEALPPVPEQAELDRLADQLDAVRDKDLWPNELYWGGL